MVLRPSADGPQALLLRRSSRLVFHGGSWVFPGGRVDPEDGQARGDDFDAARRAAVRETQEEADLQLQAQALHPLSHWTTPVGPPRRFATWFFVTTASAGRARADGAEMKEHRWFAADEALEAFAAGDVDLPPPTFVSLTWLREHRTCEDAMAAVTAAQPTIYVPRPRPVADGVVSIYGGDAGYDQGLVEHDGPRHRLWMVKGGWRYERDA